jgi:hypothetical protein
VIPSPALYFSLMAPQRQRVGAKTQIGFRLASSGGKPKEVRDRLCLMASIGMIEPGNAGKIQHDEGELKETARGTAGIFLRSNSNG